MNLYRGRVHRKHCPVKGNYQNVVQGNQFEKKVACGNAFSLEIISYVYDPVIYTSFDRSKSTTTPVIYIYIYTAQKSFFVWPRCNILYRFPFIDILGQPSFACGQPNILDGYPLGNLSANFYHILRVSFS